MNILVTGANGQLGNCIRKAVVAPRPKAPHLPEGGAIVPDNYIFTDVTAVNPPSGGMGALLDITDPDAVRRMVREHDVKVIINCAAYTNVDKAESDAEFAELLNSKAVRNLADAIKDNNGTLFHISTDYVFGGSQGNTPRAEEEPVNPTGVYGLTKLHGEQEIEKSGVKALVMRTAWLYSEYGKNFVKTMLNLTDTKPQLKVVFDQVGTPTYAQNLADVIVGITRSRAYEGREGIYHYSNEGVCSWYDFTKRIAEMSGHKDCDIQPCHSDEFPSSVVRPSYSVLDKTKIKNTFGIKVPYWTDSLAECIKNLEKG